MKPEIRLPLYVLIREKHFQTYADALVLRLILKKAIFDIQIAPVFTSKNRFVEFRRKKHPPKYVGISKMQKQT